MISETSFPDFSLVIFNSTEHLIGRLNMFDAPDRDLHVSLYRPK